MKTKAEATAAVKKVWDELIAGEMERINLAT